MPSTPERATAELDAQYEPTKIICRKTERATTIPRPPLESSRQEESKSILTILVKFVFSLFFRITFQILSRENSQSRIGFALSNTYSPTDVSDPSGVPWFVRQLIFKVVNRICDISPGEKQLTISYKRLRI